jgi:cytochrome c oxidase assembly protein subunit 15
MSNNYKYLTIFSTVLALLVVALGAYTRLSNAGLGCPDWPGCYGFLTVPNTEDELLQAANAFPNSTVEPLKAWIEMIHRYFASSLGLLVIALLFFAFNKVNLAVPRKLTVSLFVLILFQGFLGMLTVTMNLQPFIVMGHLLGGFCILALLALHCFHLLTPKSLAIHKSSTFNGYMSEFSIAILVLQIALGGWVAANYAAPHCVGLPICENIHLFSTESLFHLPVGEENYEYGVLPFETRLSIHMVHRGWAVVTLLVLAVWAWKVYQAAEEALLKNASVILIVGLITQILLGAIIVQLQFPILITLFHNLMAAILLMTSLYIWFLLRYRVQPEVV